MAKRKIRYWGKVTNCDRSYIFKCFRISRKADVNTFTSDGRCTVFAVVLNCSISREPYICILFTCLGMITWHSSWEWRQVELSRLVFVFEKFFFQRYIFRNQKGEASIICLWCITIFINRINIYYYIIYDCNFRETSERIKRARTICT